MRAFVTMDWIHGGDGRYLKMKMKARMGVFNKAPPLTASNVKCLSSNTMEINAGIHSGSLAVRRLSFRGDNSCYPVNIMNIYRVLGWS